MKLKHVGDLFLAITRLHNFCINEGDEIPLGQVEGDDATEMFIPSDVSVTDVAGNSLLRDLIVRQLAQRSLGRPQYNLERNRNQ